MNWLSRNIRRFEAMVSQVHHLLYPDDVAYVGAPDLISAGELVFTLYLTLHLGMAGSTEPHFELTDLEKGRMGKGECLVRLDKEELVLKECTASLSSHVSQEGMDVLLYATETPLFFLNSPGNPEGKQ